MKRFLIAATLLLSSLAFQAQTAPKGLKVNDMAPEFSAADQSGKMVDLKDALKKGSVVVVFYRGQWCPYCNKQLQKLEDSLTQIMDKGASLIAITPEMPSNIKTTIEKTKATYPILYDDGLAIMKMYDVAYAVSEKTIAQYKGYGVDFIEANGTKNGTNLPVPALYVINKEGKIVYRHFDPDITKRPSVMEILKYL